MSIFNIVNNVACIYASLYESFNFFKLQWYYVFNNWTFERDEYDTIG